jgi:hypothetical protein
MQAADIIATCAVIISLCSLGATICALYIQREHDQKSVLPIPQIIFGDYENYIFVAIENAGVGPFVIEEIIVENTLSHLTRHSVIEQLPSLPDQYCWTTYIEKIEQRRTLPAQQRLVLLQLDEPKDDSGGFAAVRTQVRTALGNLKLSVSGADVYENKFHCSRSLSFFHRSFLGLIADKREFAK